MPALIKAWDEAPAGNPLKSKLGRPDRAAARLGSPLGQSTRCPLRSRYSGARRSARRYQRDDIQRGDIRARISAARPKRREHAGATAGVAGGGVRETSTRFRKLEDSLGRHQSIPASHRRHCPTFSDAGAEHSGRIHLGGVGIAGLIRRAALSRDEEMVRHQREQLRSGGGVRRSGAREGGDGGRRERRSHRLRISTMRRSDIARAICGKCTFIASRLRGTRSAATIPGIESRRKLNHGFGVILITMAVKLCPGSIRN